MAGDTTEALQFAFQKLSELAHQFGPAAVDVAVQVERLDAINKLSGIPAWGLVALVAALGVHHCLRRLKEDTYEAESLYAVGSFLLGLVAIGASIAAVVCAFDVWAWTGLFNPKLALAHDVLTALASKAGA